MTLHCSAAFHSQAFSGSEDKAQQQNSRMGLVTGWHDQNRRSWPTKMGASHNWVPQNHWFPMKNEDFRMSLASTTGTRKSRDVWCTPFSVPAMWTLQFALLSGQEVTVRSQVLVARIWFELQEKAFGISTTLGLKAHQSPSKPIKAQCPNTLWRYRQSLRRPSIMCSTKRKRRWMCSSCQWWAHLVLFWTSPGAMDLVSELT